MVEVCLDVVAREIIEENRLCLRFDQGCVMILECENQFDGILEWLKILGVINIRFFGFDSGSGGQFHQNGFFNIIKEF